MTSHLLDFGDFSVSVPDGWDELSPAEQASEMPLTIADAENGVGALQISAAIYRGGPLPRFDTAGLAELLDDFARTRELRDGFDRTDDAANTFVIGESFRSRENFVRVWYVSDGRSVLLVTYTCEWDDRSVESQQTDSMVRSIRFHGPTPHSA